MEIRFILPCVFNGTMYREGDVAELSLEDYESGNFKGPVGYDEADTYAFEIISPVPHEIEVIEKLKTQDLFTISWMVGIEYGRTPCVYFVMSDDVDIKIATCITNIDVVEEALKESNKMHIIFKDNSLLINTNLIRGRQLYDVKNLSFREFIKSTAISEKFSEL